MQFDPEEGVLVAKPDFEIPVDGQIELTSIGPDFGRGGLDRSQRDEYLIALKRRETVPPHVNPAPGDHGAAYYTVLRQPCSSPFLFKTKTLKGATLRQVMATDRDKERELEILMEFMPAAERVLEEARRYERSRKD